MQSWHSFQDFPILKCHSPNASYSVAIAVKGAAYSARQVHSLGWTLKRLASVARAGNRGFLLFIHSQIIEDNLVHFCGEIMKVGKKQGNGVSPFEWAAQVGPCGALT